MRKIRAAERTEVKKKKKKRPAKPEEMQMTGEMCVHQEQPVFLRPTMYQIVSDWVMGIHPWRMRRSRIGKLTMCDPRASCDFTQKCIPELLFKTNLYCISDHRGDTVDVLNIVEFSLDLLTLIAMLSDSFCFYGRLKRRAL